MEKKGIAILLSAIITLTSMGCSCSGSKDYSYNEIFVLNDTLLDIEVGYLDEEFDKPRVITPRPYEFIVDYRYLNVDSEEKEKIKLSKLIFDKDFSSKWSYNKKSNHFFKEFCLDYINLKHNSNLKLHDLLNKNAIDIDLNVKKLVNNENAIFLLKAVITFNRNIGEIKKGDTIKQKYVLSYDGRVLAFVLDEFHSYTEEGSINDAITTLDILGLDSYFTYEEEITEFEKYLYDNIESLKKHNKI